jgi:hypothetical protein
MHQIEKKAERKRKLKNRLTFNLGAGVLLIVKLQPGVFFDGGTKNLGPMLLNFFVHDLQILVLC